MLDPPAREEAPPRVPDKGKDLPAAPPRKGALAHLMAGLGVVLARPRVLFVLVLFSFLTALPVALPVFRSAAAHLDSLAQPPGTSSPFDLVTAAPRWMIDDWMRSDSGLVSALQSSLAPLLLLASVFGLFLSAGWMNVAVRGRGEHGLSSFGRGGGLHFFPFLRTWIFGLALAGAATWVVWNQPGEWVARQFLPEGRADLAASESTARWFSIVRNAVYLLILLKIEVLLDLSRASLVAGNRRSAVLAIFRGAGFFLVQPFRVFGLVLSGLLLEAVWVGGVTTLAGTLEASLWYLVFLLPLGRIAFRGARHAGLARMYCESLGSSVEEPPAPGGPSFFDDGTAWRT
ncbi:MAG: hypothetical protein ACE5H3_08550 [Planctomycetota bacterium]